MTTDDDKKADRGVYKLGDGASLQWKRVDAGIRILKLVEGVKRVVALEVPAEIAGAPVVELGNLVFHGASFLQNVTLPTTLKKIGADAFWDCVALEELVVPEGTETIGASAFYRCQSLERVALPSTLKALDKNAFSTCQALTEIVVPEGTETIGARVLSLSKS